MNMIPGSCIQSRSCGLLPKYFLPHQAPALQKQKQTRSVGGGGGDNSRSFLCRPRDFPTKNLMYNNISREGVCDHGM